MSTVVLLAFACVGNAANGQAYQLTNSPESIETEQGGIGVSAADFNNDGWDDITIALRGAPPSVLQNNGDGTFTEVGQALGITHTGDANIPVWVDVNNDGRSDLFLAQEGEGRNRLYIAQKNGTYQDQLEAYGLDPEARIGSATFADFDLDGFVDLFLAIKNGYDVLLRNTAGTGFEDVTAVYGVAGADDTMPMQAAWIDYDRDGDPDLFAMHDLDWESRFYRNDGAGQWPEIGQANGLAYVGPGSSMGVAWGDTNLDGAPDAYVSRIAFGGLYMNNGNGTFSDESNALGAEVNGVSWGVVLSDFDNDMDEDLAVATNTSWLGNEPHMMWTNEGGFFTPTQEGFIPWSKGLASGDFNRDGLRDVVSISTKGEHQLLMNETTDAGNWLSVAVGRSETGGTPVGTRVEVDVAGTTLVRWVAAGDSYCSQSSSTVHFGLGAALTADAVRVYHGAGITEERVNVAANQYMSIGDFSISVGTGGGFRDSRPTADPGITVWPNPSGGITNLSFHAERAGLGSVTVYDVTGRERFGLVRAVSPGRNRVSLDQLDLPPGLYIARISIPGGAVQTTAMIRH
ncbi:MAG: hypothetical protein ACI9W4_001881 [Rhodothermales bacterium]|jgi:hypothetical protein